MSECKHSETSIWSRLICWSKDRVRWKGEGGGEGA